MTALLAILARAWPFLACLGIGLGIGGYLEKNRWEARYDALLASTEQRLADAQAAANQALQKQIQTRLDTEANNGKVIQQLQAERDTAAADRDFSRRLLAAAQTKPPAPGRSLPTTGNQPGATPDSTPPSDRSLVVDLGDAAAETRFCFEQYRALLEQLTPQLSR